MKANYSLRRQGEQDPARRYAGVGRVLEVGFGCSRDIPAKQRGKAPLSLDKDVFLLFLAVFGPHRRLARRIPAGGETVPKRVVIPDLPVPDEPIIRR
jgi:hypothetical protein